MTLTSDSSEDSGRGSVTGAFICGVLTGASLAMLFAPASGRDTRQRIMSRMNREYLRTLEEQLNEWSATIDGLAARASTASADAKAEYETWLGELRARRESARHTLDQLHTTGGHAWQELAAGADRAWRELRRAVDSAVSELSKTAP